MGREGKAQPCEMRPFCSAGVWLHVPASPPECLVLLPGYVGDGRMAASSQILIFLEQLSKWGWRQNPEGPGRQSWP